MSKFLTFERKRNYSWIIAIIVSVIVAWNVSVADMFFAAILQFIATFFLMIIIDQVPTNDLLKRFLKIYFFPTVVLYWIMIFVFHIDEVAKTLWNWIKILLMID